PLSPPLPRKAGDKIHWGGLSGSAVALSVAGAATGLKSVGLVIVPSTAYADRLEREIQLYLREHPDAPQVLHFPDWETLPYDNFSPHQDIVSERMRTLYQLGLGRRSIIVVSAATLVQRIVPRSYIEAKSFVVRKGDTLNLTRLKE